jgi:hypothetical protein
LLLFITHSRFSGCSSWFSSTKAHAPQDIFCDSTHNTAVLFFPQNEEFVKYFSSSMDMNIHSLLDLIDTQSFQDKSGDKNVSVFDSNAIAMSLPNGVVRLVAFSTSPIVILFQLEKFRERNIYLVSMDTSCPDISNDKHVSKKGDKILAIKAMGIAVMHSLTLFNKNSDSRVLPDSATMASSDAAPIASLYIPPFPKKLDISAKLSRDVLSSTLRAGMEEEIRHCSPHVQLAF